MSDSDRTERVKTRQEKLLAQEILACEDPVCCCEPEPRWLQFEHLASGENEPSEWEVLDRSPADEL